MEVKEILAKNLTELRKNKGITQVELAEQLNYSDKSISKWERGEGLPDLETTAKIAEFYGVTVDFLLREHKDIKKHIRSGGLISGQKVLIAICSAALVWVIATFVYVCLCWCGVNPKKADYVLIIAVPLMLIVLIVFNRIWGRVWITLILVSALLWTVALCVFLPLYSYKSLSHTNLCFIIPIPIQIAFIFFYGLQILNVRIKRKNKEKDREAAKD